MFSTDTGKTALHFLIVAATALLVVQICNVLSLTLTQGYVQGIRWYRYPVRTCNVNSTTRHDLLKLMNITMKTLEDEGTHAAVCYGTLWGVLRHEDLLPWDANVDICVLDSSTKADKMMKALRREGVTVQPFSFTYGYYQLNYGQAVGHIHVFSECPTPKSEIYYEKLYSEEVDLEVQKMHIPKWVCPKSTSFWWFYEEEDTYRPFPMHLLEPPFQKRTVAKDVIVNVPHEGVEIQKYLYPNDWWLIAKPPNCPM